MEKGYLPRRASSARLAPVLGVPALIAAVVGPICALLVVASWRAMLRTGNRAIYLVMGAFATLAVKEYAKAITLGTVGQEGPTLELVFSLFDLVAIALFAWPILSRAGGPTR